MVDVIIILLYVTGIPVTFWLLNGFDDLKPDPDDTVEDRVDMALGVCITFCISLCWPLFWLVCIILALTARFFRLS